MFNGKVKMLNTLMLNGGFEQREREMGVSSA